uniref:Uncharacterized protein n=1 Tax=Anguilla anguilla TaxID=7936 RepID=A0A0E9SQT8_ANGAN
MRQDQVCSPCKELKRSSFINPENIACHLKLGGERPALCSC